MNIFLTVGIILLVLWLLGILFYPLGGLVNILLVIALIAIIWHFVA